MSTLTVHLSIIDAVQEDLVPEFGEDDESSFIPCLDLFFASSMVELVHVGIVDDWRITPEYARFALRDRPDIDRLKRSLQTSGPLYQILVAAIEAAHRDQGLLAACEKVSAFMRSLAVK